MTSQQAQAMELERALAPRVDEGLRLQQAHEQRVKAQQDFEAGLRSAALQQDPTATPWSVHHPVLALGEVVPLGNLALNIGGEVALFTPERYRQGARLLGYAIDHYGMFTAPGREPERRPETLGMLFKRGCPWSCMSLNADPVTRADVGGVVAVADGRQVRRTIEPGDLTATLIAIGQNGYVQVLLP